MNTETIRSLKQKTEVDIANLLDNLVKAIGAPITRMEVTDTKVERNGVFVKQGFNIDLEVKL